MFYHGVGFSTPRDLPKEIDADTLDIHKIIAFIYDKKGCDN
jgi:hypothetical protein